MTFDEMPILRLRKWHRAGRGHASRLLAIRVAKWFRTRPDISEVKLVKETRWVMFWKSKHAPEAPS